MCPQPTLSTRHSTPCAKRDGTTDANPNLGIGCYANNNSPTTSPYIDFGIDHAGIPMPGDG
jgi:hypothetical protein